MLLLLLLLPIALAVPVEIYHESLKWNLDRAVFKAQDTFSALTNRPRPQLWLVLYGADVLSECEKMQHPHLGDCLYDPELWAFPSARPREAFRFTGAPRSEAMDDGHWGDWSKPQEMLPIPLLTRSDRQYFTFSHSKVPRTAETLWSEARRIEPDAAFCRLALFMHDGRLVMAFYLSPEQWKAVIVDVRTGAPQLVQDVRPWPFVDGNTGTNHEAANPETNRSDIYEFDDAARPMNTSKFETNELPDTIKLEDVANLPESAETHSSGTPFDPARSVYDFDYNLPHDDFAFDPEESIFDPTKDNDFLFNPPLDNPAQSFTYNDDEFLDFLYDHP